LVSTAQMFQAIGTAAHHSTPNHTATTASTAQHEIATKVTKHTMESALGLALDTLERRC
jgi:hypothetical protein